MAIKIDVEFDYEKLREAIREIVDEIAQDRYNRDRARYNATTYINVSSCGPNTQQVTRDVAALMQRRPC